MNKFFVLVVMSFFTTSCLSTHGDTYQKYFEPKVNESLINIIKSNQDEYSIYVPLTSYDENINAIDISKTKLTFNSTPLKNITVKDSIIRIGNIKLSELKGSPIFEAEIYTNLGKTPIRVKKSLDISVFNSPQVNTYVQTSNFITKNNPILLDKTKRFALVIGNSEYNGSFAPLKNPVNDAKAVATALEQLDFKVLLRTNVDRGQLRQARMDFEQRLKEQPDSIALIYFNGHGLQGDDGKNYLIPINADITYHEDIPEQSIGIAKIIEDINSTNPKLTIFIVDACRNGIKLQSRHKGAAINGTMTAMSATNDSAGSLIAFASSPDQYALDYVNDNDAHSPYTTALLENLIRPNYDIESVFKETRQQVLKKTNGQQTPTETSSLVGNYYFKLSQ